MLAIWSGRRRGAWWETGTVKYDVLRGIRSVGGQRIYMRKSTPAEEVVSRGVGVIGCNVNFCCIHEMSEREFFLKLSCG